LNANIKTDWNARRIYKFRSDFEFQTDYLTKDSQEQFQFNPASFYFEAKTNPLKWRAGFQTIVPEGPDILNPADVIHSKNWIDPMSPTHLSSLGLSVSQEIDAWQWEAFFIPRQTEPVLPGDYSPWWPREKRLPIESQNTEIRVPEGVAYKVNEPTELNQALKNSFMLRLLRKSENFEFQTVFYEGFSQDPHLLTVSTLTLIATGSKEILQLDSPVLLMPLYYKHRVAAMTFVFPFESWAIKGGANWMKPLGDDSRIPGERSTGVLGFEKSFETRKGLVTAILQYQGQNRQDKNQISFLRSIYESAYSLAFRIPWGEETQFLGGVIYDSIGKSSILRLSASRRLTDSWTADLEGNFLQGPEDTLLGLYGNHDRYGLGFTYHW